MDDGLVWFGNGRYFLDGSGVSFTLIFLVLVSNLCYDVADVLANVLAHALADGVTSDILDGLIVELYADLLFLCLLYLPMDGLYFFVMEACMVEFDTCIDGIEEASEPQKNQYYYGHIGGKIYLCIISLVSLIEEENS